MVEDRVQRRLAAILAADVVGYSQLMGVDEEATLRTLQNYRQIVDRLIARHEGRIFATGGDSVLAEFSSPVEAVRCSIAIQEELKMQNAELTENIPMHFRIGINLGDVMVEDENLFGDGVNVAARLEGLAEPGGICISGSAYEQVRDRLDAGFEDIGDQPVKNIDRPVRAYRVKTDQVMVPTAGAADISGRDAKGWQVPAFAALVLAVIAAASLVVWRPWQPTVGNTLEPASEERMAFALPDKPSIAVLPFNNMSADPGQEYFVDGMTEDLITDLSKVSALFVVARNSVFTYKGRAVKVQQVAEELGVRYVLEGSVRRNGDQLRINAQLIDAITGGHLWAERYDGSTANVFELQDHVTQKIVSALEVNLTDKEQGNQKSVRTENPKAYDAFLQGWELYQQFTPQSIAASVPYLEQAIKYEPGYSRAHATLAAAYLAAWRNRWVTQLGLSFLATFRKAKHHLDLALEKPTPLAHQIAAKVAIAARQHETAIVESERAIALDPNDPAGYIALATSRLYAGNAEQAAPEIEKAMRLNPHYGPDYQVLLGQIQFNTGRYENAAKTLQSAIIRNSGSDTALLYLASALGHLGQKMKSEEVIEKFTQLRQSQGLSGFNIGIIDHWPVGGPTERARLGEGLKGVERWRDFVSRKDGRFIVKGAKLVDSSTAKSLHDRNVLFIDVREQGRWRQQDHIPGAIHLELSNFNRASLSAIVPKDREVVFYCFSPICIFSAQAAAKAHTWGFTSVYYFAEGMQGWRNAGYPLEAQ